MSKRLRCERLCDVIYVNVGHVLEVSRISLENKFLATWLVHNPLSMCVGRHTEAILLELGD